MVKILIGADPELFLRNPNNNNFVSGHIFNLGDKRKPTPVQYGAVQNDGCAVEFNIDPASTVQEFVRNTQEVMKTLRTMTPGYNLCVDPVADFDKDYFDKEVPELSKMLGCDPDYNAWTGMANDPPDNTQPMRTAAGHIHIGWTDGADVQDAKHFANCCAMAKQMDYFLGIHSLKWDQDNRRRSMYGQGGAFRPKTYGCEYRVLSNRWLSSEPLMRWVYHSAVRGATSLIEGGTSMASIHGNLAQDIINNNMVDWPDKHQLSIPVPNPPGFNKAPLGPHRAV